MRLLLLLLGLGLLAGLLLLLAPSPVPSTEGTAGFLSGFVPLLIIGFLLLLAVVYAVLLVRG
ncbi:MAG: hypothetical protein DSO02_06785 [Hadesarchaea archaeon]|nr:MAG: hypothetical protein DSO02_06785 [Hadesarchaea archaeon]